MAAANHAYGMARAAAGIILKNKIYFKDMRRNRKRQKYTHIATNDKSLSLSQLIAY